LNSKVGISIAAAAASGFLAGYLASRYIQRSAARHSGSTDALKSTAEVSVPETPRSTCQSSTTGSAGENGHHHEMTTSDWDAASDLKLALIVRLDLQMVPSLLTNHVSS
jgi:hypothetical protein